MQGITLNGTLYVDLAKAHQQSHGSAAPHEALSGVDS